MNASDSGAVFEDLRWPTDINLVGTDYGRPEFFGTAVWRDDCQTYAVLVEGHDKWIGDQYGQFPTIAALCWGLGYQGLGVTHNSMYSLHGLAAVAETLLGRAWLVGIETTNEAVLAVVHPDKHIERLDPMQVAAAGRDPVEDVLAVPGVDNSGVQHPETRFSWSGDDPEALLSTATAAFGAAVGEIGGIWKSEATWLIDRGFTDLPAEFAVPLSSLQRGLQSVRVFAEASAIGVLDAALTQPDLQQTRDRHEPQGLGR